MFNSNRINALKASKHAPYICLLIIVALQVSLIVIVGFRKQGFFVDELWSYGLANSLFYPHLFYDNALEGKWVDGSVFHDYIIVNTGEEFRYDSVLFNLANDIHPPQYFIVLHTICSLFPNTFNKWFAIIPNIVYFVIAQGALYRLSRRAFDSKWMGLLPVLIWGFSPGAISFALFARMYMMATAYIVLVANVHYSIIAESKRSLLNFALLALVSFAAFMCHYYILIVSFFMAVCTVIYCLLKREWRLLLCYSASMVVSLAVLFAVYPLVLSSLFGSTYTTRAANAGFSFEKLNTNMSGFLTEAARDICFNNGYALVAFVAAAVLAFLQGIRVKSDDGWRSYGGRFYFWAITACAVVLFFVLASYVSPFVTSRYICIVYPIAIYAFTWIFAKGFKPAFKLVHEHAPLVVGLIALVLYFGLTLWHYGAHVSYVYPHADKNVTAIESQDEPVALFLTNDYYYTAAKVLELEQCDKVWTAIPAQAAKVVQEVDQQAEDSIVVYLDYASNHETVLEQIEANSRYDSHEVLKGYRALDDGTLNIVAYRVYDDPNIE